MKGNEAHVATHLFLGTKASVCSGKRPVTEESQDCETVPCVGPRASASQTREHTSVYH